MSSLLTLQKNVAGVLGLSFDSATPTAGDGPRLLGWANDAVIDVLKRTHCHIAIATMPLTSGKGDYELDTSILAIDDIFLSSGGGNLRVRRMTTTDLINLRLFSVTTSPMQMFATNGANMLMVYPTPLSPDTLSIYYVPKPTALANSADDPSTASLGGIPSEYHYGLELYMMWRAGDAVDDETSSQGETYRRQYLGDPTAPMGTEQRFGFIGTMKREMREMGTKHLGGVLIPPRGRRIYIPDPGVDAGSQTSF